MNPKIFVGLIAVTVAVSVASAFGVAGRYGGSGLGRIETLLFEDLEDKVDLVKEIVVRHSDGVITVKLGERGWVLTEKTYPARLDRVRQTVFGLAGLRLIEAKTKMPERFDRLMVEDVDTNNAQSKLLSLKDDAGNILAEVIVGKTRSDLVGIEKYGVYVRTPGEMQTWLARGRLDVSDNPQDWVLREIVDLASMRISRVTTRAPGGAKLSVFKTTPSDKKFAIEDLPKDAKLRENVDSLVDNMGSVLTGLELSDVAPVTEIEFSGKNITEAEVRTFDGLVINLTLVKKDKKTWARVTASAESDDVAKEAAAINARVQGWAYQLPAHKAKPLENTLSDLLQPKAKSG